MKNELNQTLTWEVEQQQLQIDNGDIKGKFALRRTDTGEILNICSNRYRPFYNSDLLHLIDKIENSSSFKLEGFEEFGKGKRILAFLKNDQTGILGGQEVKDFLIIGNSHNSSSKVFAGMSNFMFRCENQFSGDLYSLRAKHVTGFVADKIDPKIILNNYHQNRNQLDVQVKEMMNTKLDWEEVIRIVDRLIDEAEPIVLKNELNSKNSKRRHEILDSIHREMDDLGRTAWGFYNGITYYTSNKLKGKSGFGITNGLGERFNRLAWEFSQRAVNRERNRR